MERLGTVALWLLSIGVAAYAIFAYTALPLGRLVHPGMRAAFEAHAAGIYMHIYGSAVALTLGPLQFSRRLRAHRPALHRWLGRVYLTVGVLVGGSAGLYMSAFAYGGIVSTLGFGLLAALWLASGTMAYAAIRRRDVAAHRRWMVRNFALAFAAVTLRLYLPSSMAAGIPFEIAYPAIAWLCWVPNVAVAEWLVRRPGATSGPRAAGAV